MGNKIGKKSKSNEVEKKKFFQLNYENHLFEIII